MLILAMALAVGNWTVEHKPDALNDKIVVTARLQGKGGDFQFICGGGQDPELAFVSSDFLGGGIGRYELRDFVYRFDGAPAQKASWKYVRDAAIPYSQKDMSAFATRMIQGKTMVIRAKRYDGGTIDATFDLAGSAQAFNEAFTRCGIKPG